MSFKLETYTDTAEIILRHPEYEVDIEHEDGRPVSITIYGDHSDFHRKAVNRRLNRKIKNPKSGKKKTIEELADENIELLAECTVSLNNFDGVDFGKGEIPKDITPAELYAEYPFVKEQIQRDMNVLGNFREKPKPKTRKR